jgi:acyl-CoA synthetase (AMP-forming)/AMP-acid ligase II
MTIAGPEPRLAHQRRAFAHIATLLEDAARRLPDAVALREREVDWTYSELLGAAREAMDLFATRGVIAGDRVVIVAENGLAQVAAFFGASLLGHGPCSSMREPARARSLRSGRTPSRASPPTRPASTDAATIARELGQRLASYKRPSRIGLVDEFPLEPTGKILKHRLGAELQLQS